MSGEVDRPVLRRYAQYVLDRVLVVAGSLLATLLAAALALGFLWLVRGPVEVLWLPLVVLVASALGGSLLVEVWFPHRRGGATPAMRWLGLRVVTLRGNQPELRALVLRWLLISVDDLFFGLVGAVLIAVTPRHQRLGDLVARTVVVRVR